MADVASVWAQFEASARALAHFYLGPPLLIGVLAALLWGETALLAVREMGLRIVREMRCSLIVHCGIVCSQDEMVRHVSIFVRIFMRALLFRPTQSSEVT